MQFSYRTLLVKVLAKQKKALIIHLIDYNNIKGFNSAASKQNPPQSPFEKGGRFEVSPFNKGEVQVLHLKYTVKMIFCALRFTLVLLISFDIEHSLFDIRYFTQFGPGLVPLRVLIIRRPCIYRIVPQLPPWP
jgi:hypothetical protein